MFNYIEFEKFLRNKTSRDNTVISRLSDVKIFFKIFGSINHKNVQMFVSEQVEAEKDASTINRRVSSLKRAASFINMNIGDIDTPKCKRKIPDILTKTELFKLNAVVDDITIHDGLDKMNLKAFFILLNNSPRRSEILGIDIDDVDLEGARIKVLAKGGDEDFIPIIFGIKVLSEYMGYRKSIDTDCPALFIHRYHKKLKRLQYREMYDLLYNLTISVLGRKVNPHTFRHSIATHIYRKTKNLRGVQELLRHSDISTTQIYTHMDKEMMGQESAAAHPLA